MDPRLPLGGYARVHGNRRAGLEHWGTAGYGQAFVDQEASGGHNIPEEAESIIGLYKTEVIHRRGPWRNSDAVEYATLEWIDWFNHRRLLEPIGNVPPAELELKYDRQQSELAIAA